VKPTGRNVPPPVLSTDFLGRGLQSFDAHVDVAILTGTIPGTSFFSEDGPVPFDDSCRLQVFRVTSHFNCAFIPARVRVSIQVVRRASLLPRMRHRAPIQAIRPANKVRAHRQALPLVQRCPSLLAHLQARRPGLCRARIPARRRVRLLEREPEFVSERQSEQCRYFVGLRKADWREATQHERIECMGIVLNVEKEQQFKRRIKWSQLHLNR
jgi:hypothetical protein